MTPKDFTDPAQLRAFGEYSIQSGDKLLAAAPDDIRAALTTQSQGTRALSEYYRAGTPPPPEAVRKLNSPAFRAAAQQIAAYGRKHCGFTPGSIG